MTGPNWTSPLEMGIRLINWALVWQLAGGADGPLFAGGADRRCARAWLDSIHAHCRCIARHLSRHSSANNHLIGELAGLYVAATAWPCWEQSARWRDQAARELEHEAQAQFSSDGVNREQAFGYHVFSCEFLHVAALAGQASGRPFSAQYRDSLERALRFLRSVTDAGGHVPMVGDADDGAVYRLDPANPGRAALLLSLGDAPHGATARWLLRAFPGQHARAGKAAKATGWAFPDGGYLLFGRALRLRPRDQGHARLRPARLPRHRRPRPCRRAVADAVGGGRGMPGRSRHLVILARPEVARLLPRHIGAQYGAVDGADQSVSGGRFMWLRKANTRIERMPQSPGQFDFCGSHDGYMRLPDPARQCVSVRFDDAALTLMVQRPDRGEGRHRLEQFWHFAPGLDVTRTAGGVYVRGKAFGMDVLCQGRGPPSTWCAGRKIRRWGGIRAATKRSSRAM